MTVNPEALFVGDFEVFHLFGMILKWPCAILSKRTPAEPWITPSLLIRLKPRSLAIESMTAGVSESTRVAHNLRDIVLQRIQKI